MKKISVRRELLRTMSLISVITMLIVGGILSVVMFRQSSALLQVDMTFYTQSIFSKLANHLRLVEDAVLYIQKNEDIRGFLQEKEGGTDKFDRVGEGIHTAGSTSGGQTDAIRSDEGKKTLAQSAMESGIHLFSEWNMVEEVNPFFKDLYILNEKMEILEMHFYPESSAVRNRQRERIVAETREYREQNEMFMHKQYGNDLELYFSLYDDYMRRIGYGVAILDKNSVDKIFSGLSKYENFAYLIVDKEWRDILGHPSPSLHPQELTQSQGKLSVSGNAYYYSQFHHSFDLQTVILIRTDALYRSIKPAFFLAWMLTISVMVVSVLVISYFSKRITKPLQTMVGKLSELGTGDFDVRLEDYSLQEFHEISLSFNDMTKKIRKLIKEVYENELIAKEARLQYFQAQINPHFLFNVLTMISLRSKMKKDEKTYRMVHSLAGLMQGKIFRKNEIEIPIMDEMEITEFYLYLSGERFKDRVFYEIVWEDESLKECVVPKLCIEPIVENAVIHGIEPKAGEGFIRVVVSRKEEKLCITVTDNGVGFEASKAYHEHASRHPRVGIMNTSRLIRNLYGDGYGIQIESKIGEGSKVEILLPLNRKKTI